MLTSVPGSGVRVGNSYVTSEPPFSRQGFQVRSLLPDYFTATYSMGMTVGHSNPYRFDYDGRFLGIEGNAGFLPAAPHWQGNLQLGHDLRMGADERAAWDALVERAADLDWPAFREHYESLIWSFYADRQDGWSPAGGLPCNELTAALDLHHRRVVESLNAGRRVMVLALREYPFLWDAVKGRVVRNGSYVFRSLDWVPVSGVYNERGAS